MAREAAVVTGSGRGIGAAAAVELGARGYGVVVNYFSRADAAEQVVVAVRDAGGEAVAVAGDMREPADARRVIGAATTQFGRLDALVCNAATPIRFAPSAELEFAELAGKISDELAAAFHPVRHAVPALRAAGGGRMVFVSSEMGRHQSLAAGVGHGTAKAALNAFVRYLAVEYGPDNITANIVSPGYTRTENSAANAPVDLGEAEQRFLAVTPLRRLATARDVGRVAARLAADVDGYVTGALIPVTGGYDIAR